MATKKVGKAAMLAARKSRVSVTKKWIRPNTGDVVWVLEKDIIGVFDFYDQKYWSLVLTWPSGYPVLLPYAWPSRREVFHPIDLGKVVVLTPSEILEKVDYFLRHRDERFLEQMTAAAEDNIRGTLFIGKP